MHQAVAESNDQFSDQSSILNNIFFTKRQKESTDSIVLGLISYFWKCIYIFIRFIYSEECMVRISIL